MEEDKNKEYNVERKLNTKKAIFVGSIFLIIMLIIIIFSLYIVKEDFRKWMDINVLRKNISNEDVACIDLNTDKNNQVYCYGRNICILKDKNLLIYNSSGESIEELPIDINTALFAVSNKYLSVAENSGKKVCLILDKTILWEENVEGEILQVHVNNNGYVAVVWADTTYKSIITLYNSDGTEIFKNYLSSTRVVDVAISKDNKYVAFAEMDTSGTLIQSNIKIISVDKVVNNAEDAIIYTKNADINRMVVKIKYQEKGNLVCMYDDCIKMISESKENDIISIDQNTTFASVDMKDTVVHVKEETSGIFNFNSVVNIVNTTNNQVMTYSFSEVAKEIYTYEDIIGINIGTDIYFVNTSGMLIKKYTSKQEITNVVLSNNLALIIYKDRVEIINL